MEENIRVHLIIKGRVQGVYFRLSTKEEADDLGLTGWARNLPDGAVEVVAEGPEDDIEDFVDWCRQGPPMARVDSVDIQRLEATGEFTGFSKGY